ncbi:methyltransferase domain-containing protein [Okeania sp.]|uniref:methyltransferase domain-containing protein n=1 Tax=Okeania sp. TaxID=3100323 RepID=UPI002B4AEB4B|nr:methyltransferase domain-containing protein [Okeania sp.]MEB3341406.1 methyltransferase domain-containing protein [Okeania sp.]
MPGNLTEEIQQFYDASSNLWEQTWGEHMHHGYYGPDGQEKKNRRQAQIDMIEELLHWATTNETSNLWPPASILDVGCGIGGSTLYLAEKFNATATGITLSPVQANRAKERAESANLSERTNFMVADALDMPFVDESYDLVWSLESGEHMPNKQKFLQECHRVLKPGGKIIMATWCHRSVGEFDEQLTDDERRHLADIYRVYTLPYVISLPEYEAIAQNIGFKNIFTADWSTAVAPFWDVVIESAFDPQVLINVLFSGWTTIQAALSLRLMSSGYERGLIKFGLLCGNK